MFKLRIVTVDHYLAKPIPELDDCYSEFRGRETSRVPVIRIFGVTEEGVKACLHVHGVYPYLCVPCEPTGSGFTRMAKELNERLNTGMKFYNPKNFRLDQVHRIQTIRAIPYYGFHEEERTYAKISLYNPLMVKRASEMFLDGQILEQTLQPHMSHVPFILQFFIDYNLYGMNFIILSKVRFRTDAGNLVKTTSCQTECDCTSSDILNNNNDQVGGGLDLIWEEEKERRRRLGKPSQPPVETPMERTVHELFSREAKFQEILDAITENNNPLPSHAYNVTDLAQIASEIVQNNIQTLKNDAHDFSDDEHFEEIIDEDIEEETFEMSQRFCDIVRRPSQDDAVEQSRTTEHELQVLHNPGPSTSASQESYDYLFDDEGDEVACSISEVPKVELHSSLLCDEGEECFDDDFDGVLCECFKKSTCCDLCCNHKTLNCKRNIPQLDGSYDTPERKKRRKKLFRQYSLPSTKRRYSERGSSSKKKKKRVPRQINGEKVLLSPSISQAEIDQMNNMSIDIPVCKQDNVKKSGRRLFIESKNKDGDSETTKTPLVESEFIDPKPGPSKEKLASQESSSSSTIIDCPFSPRIVCERLDIPTSSKSSPDLDDSDPIYVSSDDEQSLMFAKNSSEIFSFYDYSSQNSIRSTDSPSSMPINSQISINSPQTSIKSPQISSQGALSQGDLPLHSTPTHNRFRKRRSKSRLSEVSLGDLSCISPASQPLATIREESSLSPQKPLKNNEPKFYTAEEYLRLKNNEPLQSHKKSRKRNISCDSFIRGATPSQSFDFAVSSFGESGVEAMKGVSSHEFQRITTMSLELHCETRPGMLPDPQCDSIRVVFYSFMEDEPTPDDQPKFKTGLIVVDFNIEFQDLNVSRAVKRPLTSRSGFLRKNVEVTVANDETDLIMKLIEVIRKADPDIILGFEIEMSSWGYLVDRCQALNIGISSALSRLIDTDPKLEARKEDQLNNSVRFESKFHLVIPGRIVLNFWRILRHEVTLSIYTYESCHFHILHERIPRYSHDTLNKWFSHECNLTRSRVFEYYITRSEGSLRIISKLGLIPKTSTLARVYGIQFSEVFSRGSQFRVESMMLRYAKRFKYIPISPSPRQRTHMYAPEYVPLIMEPESKFYTDPVVVLDFQSLYPTMVIAYNYCYSTCLGKVTHLQKDAPFPFGCSTLRIEKETLKNHRDDIHVAPNGVGFIKKSARHGILPRMLEEILNTRIMVKNAMKENAKSEHKSNSLQRLLDARQLALKLIANVTYGYTAANFSGRMPCVEIADAIVSKGKETLNRAIDLVHANFKRWGAKVVYGDTDSLFILFSGCTKDEAFIRGKEIAEEVTRQNPEPVKLKFEKVYLPCVLQTKKRYVGYCYEDIKQETPTFDAKGIETVRRDSCSATGKILEKSLRILFETRDPEKCKSYVLSQFQKLLSGKMSIIQDFVFAKEFRGHDRYSQFARVPALELAKKMFQKDPRSEPRRGERVPYVIVYGSPDQSLYELVRHPSELITNPNAKLNAVYYIERVIIPPLNRVFMMLSQDIFKWYEEMPRKPNVTRTTFFRVQNKKKKNQTTISQFFVTTSCQVCGGKTEEGGVCKDCMKDKQSTGSSLIYQIVDIETKYRDTLTICAACNGCSQETSHECCLTECPNLFRYSQAKVNLSTIENLNHLLKKLEF